MKAEKGIYPKDRQLLYKILPLDTPLVIDMHITHICNFRCNYCILSEPDEILQNSSFARGLKREPMSWETFSLAVGQMKAFPRKIKQLTMSGVGEATTHPKLVDMVQALHDANVTDKIQIISNGWLLSPSMSEKLISAGLNELRISLQGMNNEKYTEVCGAKIDWDTLYNNIHYFSSIRGDNCTLKVKVADIALDGTDDEKKFYDFFGNICDAVDIEHIYDSWSVNGVEPIAAIKPTAKTRYGREPIEIRDCRRPFTSLDIMPDGLVTQTCHIIFGFEKNISESPLIEQWNSKEWNDIRRKMLVEGRSLFDSCKDCSYVINTYHPEDILDGHEDEILMRMKNNCRR